MWCLLKILLVKVLLANCALAPQQIDHTLQLKATIPSHSAFVNVRVQDKRQTANIGSRGGVYAETAMITSKANVSQQIQASVYQLLQKHGYQQGARGTLITISLDTLQYQALKINNTTYDIQVQVALEILAYDGVKTQGRKVSRRKMITRILPPQADINQKLINDTLTQALEVALSDAAIQQLMQAHTSAKTGPMASRDFFWQPDKITTRKQPQSNQTQTQEAQSFAIEL